ncbi:hypothetical protein B0H13DRAFT_2650528 [Mycena leptocephala]|nr:hypothetical protein B0H13DRAFT_2650528 [Mycena leptocephala]
MYIFYLGRCVLGGLGKVSPQRDKSTTCNDHRDNLENNGSSDFLSTRLEFIPTQYKHRHIFGEYNRESFLTNSSNLTGECSGCCICHSNRIPPRVIAAICVAVASVVVGLTIALLLCAKHRRRAAKHGATAVDYDANTVSPFTLVTEMDGHNTPPRDSDIRSVSPSTITRQGLETELWVVHEKMADLQDLERSSTTAGSGTRGVSGLMSMRRSSIRGVPDVEAQLETSREQINMLVTRMQALEATTNSRMGRGSRMSPRRRISSWDAQVAD